MKNKKTWYYVGVGALILFLVFQSVRINNLMNKNNLMKSNMDAIQDTLRKEKTKTGQLEYAKLAYQTNANELKKLNLNLYNELKKEKGNVTYIASDNVKILHDTIFADIEYVIRDTVNRKVTWDWKYAKEGKNWREKFKGVSGVSDSAAWTRIDSLDIEMNLVTGLRKVKDNYEIFIRSDYPNFHITSLEGAIVDKNMFVSQKKKRWSIGPSVGAHWDLYSGKIRPYIGAGITRTFIKF